ncbi:toll/interleukin-1 receptor domain-containing protein [Aquabacterium sp. OR-4]|uniref:toll/interleukin-1 receptor domain-containing protein n=1 Tax=Aquabacterium sp. OR-4 TaxID=2978127 RepID=UPI0021B30261|nr:toll/interleukin-1 receptor domain-containing protein [Aquabacterium sp. OR-4]MDT7835695.1 toll/interleukin-1 receptor domain-containing protein [Aquabacterium sp. OR-4]
MGYLPQFKNDLFLSYRRASNEGPDAWIDTFRTQVETVLRDRVGDISIWRDKDELNAGEAWRPAIAEGIDTSGLFLAVISRTYFDSPECRKEFDRFLGRLKAGAGDGLKLVPIFKHPPKPDQELPRELAEIGHHEFFVREPKPWRELDPKLASDYGPYHERMGRVLFELAEAIEALHSQQKKQALGKVFLATVPPELNSDRERLRSDLRLSNFVVVPEREYLWNADDYQDRIAQDLADSLLAVHLVSGTASTEPLSAERSRIQLQLAAEAMARHGRPAPLVRMLKSETVDAATQPLVEYIRNVMPDKGIELFEGSLEELKSDMFGKLPKPAPKTAARAVAKPREMAVLVEDGEAAEIDALKQLLTAKLGVKPLVQRFTGSTPKDAGRLAKVLADCPQALVVWHRQDDDWVQALLDSEVLAGHASPERLAVYVMGEGNDMKTDFATPQASLIRALVSPAEAELAAFVKAWPDGSV